MTNVCTIVSEQRRTREELQKFAASTKNIELARKRSPYHREGAANPHQIDFLEQLRTNYCTMQSGNPLHEIVIRKYKLPSRFALETSHRIRPVELMHGLYRPDEPNHVDFANKNLGGGFLTYGMAEDEVCCCERTDFGMFIAEMYARNTPFTMEEDEAIVISGADMCAAVDFYGSVPSDWDSKSCFFREPEAEETDLIAIDCIHPRWKKYERRHLLRCVKKAYCGFQGATQSCVTTGQWGCGAFFNNSNVMFCVQALAAWMAGKKLFYHCRMHHVAKGYDMVKRWGEGPKATVSAALDELELRCATDPDFETSWDPTVKFDEVILAGNLLGEVGSKDENRIKIMAIKDFSAYAAKKWPGYGRIKSKAGKEASLASMSSLRSSMPRRQNVSNSNGLTRSGGKKDAHPLSDSKTLKNGKKGEVMSSLSSAKRDTSPRKGINASKTTSDAKADAKVDAKKQFAQLVSTPSGLALVRAALGEPKSERKRKSVKKAEDAVSRVESKSKPKAKKGDESPRADSKSRAKTKEKKLASAPPTTRSAVKCLTRSDPIGANVKPKKKPGTAPSGSYRTNHTV